MCLLFGSIGKKCNKCINDYVTAKDGQCVFQKCYSGYLECGGNGQCVSLQCVCNENFTIESNCVECINRYTNQNGTCVFQGNTLSKGAIAGIVITLFSAILVLGIGILFSLKRKKGKETVDDKVINKQ